MGFELAMGWKEALEKPSAIHGMGISGSAGDGGTKAPLVRWIFEAEAVTCFWLFANSILSSRQV